MPQYFIFPSSVQGQNTENNRNKVILIFSTDFHCYNKCCSFLEERWTQLGRIDEFSASSERCRLGISPQVNALICAYF
jgi:hypothetical protein